MVILTAITMNPILTRVTKNARRPAIKNDCAEHMKCFIQMSNMDTRCVIATMNDIEIELPEKYTKAARIVAKIPLGTSGTE